MDGGLSAQNCIFAFNVTDGNDRRGSGIYLGSGSSTLVNCTLAYNGNEGLNLGSGAATVLGWIGHELQWRGPLPELSRRQADIEQIYRGDPQALPGLLARYGVRFVVVSDIERAQYGAAVDTRFEGVLPVAFRAGPITIYRALSS